MKTKINRHIYESALEHFETKIEIYDDIISGITEGTADGDEIACECENRKRACEAIVAAIRSGFSHRGRPKKINAHVYATAIEHFEKTSDIYAKLLKDPNTGTPEARRTTAECMDRKAAVDAMKESFETCFEPYKRGRGRATVRNASTTELPASSSEAQGCRMKRP